MRFADIAVNLTDPMFQGTYHGRKRHEADLPAVLERARGQGVERLVITGTSLGESREALRLAKLYNLHCTAGVHPTSTSELDKHPAGPDAYLKELRELIAADRADGADGGGRIISIGEIGLDYDRLHFSSKETQLSHLPSLLALGKEYGLPLFLHSRTPESHVDLVRALNGVGFGFGGGGGGEDDLDDSDATATATDGEDGEGVKGWRGGVVHSFTGSMEEMKELVALGLYIGINGCSLKTPENLEVVKQIPIDKLLLETDAPWCSPTTAHASHPHLPLQDSELLLKRVSKPEKFKVGLAVKGRMEPAEVAVIAHIVASVRGESLEYLADKVWDNTIRLFYPHEAAAAAAAGGHS